MSTQRNYLFTPEEYLSLERCAEYKSEYTDGHIVAMTGASFRHIQIVGNITISLGLQLKKRRCSVLSNEMKARLPDSSKFYYPDIIVMCGEPQFHDRRTDVLLNPTLIIEVLSDSTEAFDRGRKFQDYQRIEFLREYVLVAQDRFVIEQFFQQTPGVWTYSATIGLDNTIMLPSIECTLALADVYDKISDEISSDNL